MTNQQQIKLIVQSVTVTPDRNILLNGRKWGADFSNPVLRQPNNKMLFQSLQNILYSVFYTRNSKTIEAAVPAAEEIESFLNELSQENESVESFDPGWTIDQVDANGTINASKGSYQRVIYPGEFVNESGFLQSARANMRVRLYARNEHKSLQTGFYYLFGKTLAEDNSDSLVRLYFNLKPEGAKKLVHILSRLFNEYEVPFSFKCLNHPQLYNRADSGVLYFDKRYSSIVFYLLNQIHSEIKQYLKQETPLFTLQLAPGIGFAENPPGQDESFGTHTTKMITQGYLHCLNHQVPEQKWVNEISANITERHGYKDIEILYLNPGSSYPYQFPAL